MARQYWRMSFRAGNRGPKMWPQCYSLGVAAITYRPLVNIDLKRCDPDKLTKLWRKMAPTQKASLRRVAYEMKKGDVIYVKEGKRIVGKGIVAGGYHFDKKRRLRAPNGYYWRQQIPVKWQADFVPVPLLLGGEQVTVLPLTGTDVDRIERGSKQEMKKISLMQVEEGSTQRSEIKFRQRNRSIIAAKKAQSDGCCEICGINLQEKYHLPDAQCLVAHHLCPIGGREKASITRLMDIQLVCPNCHAIAHSRKPPLSRRRIRNMLRLT